MLSESWCYAPVRVSDIFIAENSGALFSGQITPTN